MKTQLLTISTVALLLIGQSAMAFEQINNESGYDHAYRNGWVSPETASALSMDSMKASFRSNATNMRGQFEDSLSINYLTTK